MDIRRNITLSLAAIACIAELDAATSGQPRTSSAGYDDGIGGKWEFRLSAGGQFGSYNDEALLFDAGVGYNCTSNVYLGIATGVFPYFGVVDKLKSCAFVPLMADFTLRSNPSSGSWSPYLQLRSGLLIPGTVTGMLENGDPYDRQNYFAVEIGPGVCLRPTPNIDLRLWAGYMLAVPGDDGVEPEPFNHTEHLFQFRVGISFRQKPQSSARQAMLASTERAQADLKREQKEEQERLKALHDEQHRKESEASAARHHQQEEKASQRSLQNTPEEAGNKSAADLPASPSLEFFCHVMPGTVAAGASLDNDLIRLATIVAGNEVASIIVLGYDDKAETSEDVNIVRANVNADRVRSYLMKRYVIDRNLMSVSYSGYEDLVKDIARPEGAIASILIERQPKPSQP